FTTHDPATEDPIGDVPFGEAEDIDRAVAAARAAFDDGPWQKITPMERGRMITRLGDLILENAEELAQLETLDNGRPIAVSRPLDIPVAAESFYYQAGWSTKLTGTTFRPSVSSAPGSEFLGMTLREPVGVVGAITPWNAPLFTAAWKLAP